MNPSSVSRVMPVDQGCQCPSARKISTDADHHPYSKAPQLNGTYANQPPAFTSRCLINLPGCVRFRAPDEAPQTTRPRLQETPGASRSVAEQSLRPRDRVCRQRRRNARGAYNRREHQAERQRGAGYRDREMRDTERQHQDQRCITCVRTSISGISGARKTWVLHEPGQSCRMRLQRSNYLSGVSVHLETRPLRSNSTRPPSASGKYMTSLNTPASTLPGTPRIALT